MNTLFAKLLLKGVQQKKNCWGTDKLYDYCLRAFKV